MNYSRLFFLVISFLFFSNTACKKTTNTFQEIPIAWEYAESDQFEPISFVADKEFKALEEKQIHSLSSLLPGEQGYIWVRGFFDYKIINEPVSISLGKIISAEVTYLNRNYLGGTISQTKEQWNYWNLYRHYSVPKEYLVEGKNEILLKVYLDSEGSIPQSIEIGNREEIDSNHFSKMFYESYLNGVVTVLFLVISFHCH